MREGAPCENVEWLSHLLVGVAADAATYTGKDALPYQQAVERGQQLQGDCALAPDCHIPPGGACPSAAAITEFALSLP